MSDAVSPHVPGGLAAAAPSDRDRIVDAAMALVGARGWHRLSMSAIAEEADLPILSVYRIFSSKPAILCAFFRRIDEAVLATPVEAEADERPRDRLFDLLMRRFDALRPYRDALVVLGRELPTDPPIALLTGARLLGSIQWMLEAGGIPAGGLRGAVAVKLTAAVYLATLRVWLADDSPDLGPTMATLDRRLRGIERWLGWARPRERSAPPAEA
ncbi:MAG TPA: TetR family transcriptional regulator [Stellaceae bacterium]|nr:TetR family transcriptional regulator [Stellaceae bacterium]